MVTLSRYIPASTRNAVELRARRQAEQVPCQVQIPGVCRIDDHREFHHRRMFARGGRHTQANLVVACDSCHVFIHRHVRWSIGAGLLVIFHPRRYWRRHEHTDSMLNLP